MQACVLTSVAAEGGVAGRSKRAGETAWCDIWQDEHALTPTVKYEPTWASGETPFVAVTWILFAQPASGFTCPCATRFGSWQARHICAFELSRTRKFCAMRSIFCTCGS